MVSCFSPESDTSGIQQTIQEEGKGPLEFISRSWSQEWSCLVTKKKKEKNIEGQCFNFLGVYFDRENVYLISLS